LEVKKAPEGLGGQTLEIISTMAWLNVRTYAPCESNLNCCTRMEASTGVKLS